MEGKRIFVFNRRILSDETKEPQRLKLLPYEVMKPDLTSGKHADRINEWEFVLATLSKQLR